MDVTGNTKIYRKDFDGRAAYSRRIASKDYVDGQKTDNWIGVYERVQMPKGTDLPDATVIKVKRGFEAVYRRQNGDLERKLVVMDYEVIERGGMPKPEPAQEGFDAIYDDSIPF